MRLTASRSLLAALLWLLGLPLAARPAAERALRFYDDDPIAVVPETQDAGRVEPRALDLAAEFVENLFGRPGDPTDGVPAQNVNTIGEVPDSSWFTNRLGSRPLTVEAIARAVAPAGGPADGPLLVDRKTEGITPGLRLDDARGTRWFVKFDPKGHRGMASGAEIISTRLLWALGYHVPENVLVRLRPAALRIGPQAVVRTRSGRTRRMTQADLDALLDEVTPEPDGRYRALASRALDGRPVGPFLFHGTRPDDPNDLVPHEHRRELRGLRVFAAWLNHVDSKASNTLDTLVRQPDGTWRVRHHLLDFGSTLGSAAVYPREPWEGFDYIFEGGREVALGIAGLGFALRPWRTVRFHEAPAVGRLPADHRDWDPGAWRPRIPNPAFLRAQPADAFWAATKLAAVTDELIRWAVASAELNDPAADAFLVRALIERRDAILRTYLPAVNPIVEPALDAGGTLRFANAAVRARVAPPPAGYRAAWYRFDNATGTSTPLGETVAREAWLEPPADLPREPGAFVRIDVAAEGGPDAWRRPVRLYFRRGGTAWTLVGAFREDSPAGPSPPP
ncbi:MAG TPA: hypothetical protein VNI83_10645 [Vicinamibacterales bacterium]|nr:hypothetical protein [Vicinamibacterales bacterium]